MQQSTTTSPTSPSASQTEPVSPHSSVPQKGDSVLLVPNANPPFPISSSPEPMQRDMASSVHDTNTDSCYLFIHEGDPETESGMRTPPLAHPSSSPPPLHSLVRPIVVASCDLPPPLCACLPEPLSNVQPIAYESLHSASDRAA